MFAIGIDLGTTGARVAMARDDRVELLEITTGTYDLPVVISYASSRPVVGMAARGRLVTDPGLTVRAVKRLLGKHASSPDVLRTARTAAYGLIPGERGLVSLKLGSRVLEVDEVVAEILNKLRELAEVRAGGKVQLVVLTVPPAYSEEARETLRRAAERARLGDVVFVPEPLAAVASQAAQGARRLVTVVDIGASYTTSALVLAGTGRVGQLVQAESAEAGGEDVDRELVTMASEQLGIHLDPTMFEFLRHACQMLKHDLCSASTASAQLPPLPTIKGDRTLRMDISHLRKALRGLLSTVRSSCIRLRNAAVGGPAVLGETFIIGGMSLPPDVQAAVDGSLAPGARAASHKTGTLATGAARLAAHYLANPDQRPDRARASTTPPSPAQPASTAPQGVGGSPRPPGVQATAARPVAPPVEPPPPQQPRAPIAPPAEPAPPPQQPRAPIAPPAEPAPPPQQPRAPIAPPVGAAPPSRPNAPIAPPVEPAPPPQQPRAPIAPPVEPPPPQEVAEERWERPLPVGVTPPRTAQASGPPVAAGVTDGGAMPWSSSGRAAAPAAAAMLQKGRFTNPNSAIEMVKMPLTRALTQADMDPIMLPVLLTRIGLGLRLSGTLTINAADQKPLVIPLDEGEAQFLPSERTVLLQCFHETSGTYGFSDTMAKPHDKHGSYRMLPLVIEGLRNIMRGFQTEDLAEAMSGKIKLAPYIPPRQLRYIGVLGLSPLEARLVRFGLDGKQSAFELVEHGGVGKRTSLGVLILMSVLDMLKWNEAEEKKQQSIAEELQERAAGLPKADLFQCLLVHWTAGREDIDAAYQKMCKDMGEGSYQRMVAPEACKKLLEKGKEAYEYLRDDNNRLAYRLKTHPDHDYDSIADLLHQKAQSVAMHADTRPLESVERQLGEVQATRKGLGKKSKKPRGFDE
jgi:hypothetical protein